MRAAVLVLLVVNVVLFVYARLDRAAQSEAGRLATQVRPDRIRLLPPDEAAAFGATKVAATGNVCAEWGPFGEVDRLRAEQELEPAATGRSIGVRPLSTDATYWVNLGGMPARAVAERRAAELRAQAISDLSVVDYPRGQFTVSLGLYRSQSAADARAQALAARGVLGTRVEPRPTPGMQSLLVVRDPPDAVVARMKELTAQYAGTDVKVVTCAQPS